MAYSRLENGLFETYTKAEIYQLDAWGILGYEENNESVFFVMEEAKESLHENG